MPTCALGQVVWVGNARIAYATLCPVAGSSNVLSRLYILRLGGMPKLLASVRSMQQDQRGTLSIAPPVACIRCE